MNPQLNLFDGYVLPEPKPGSALLDLVGDAEPNHLRRTDHAVNTNTAELRLLSRIDGLMDRTLPSFVASLQVWMDTTNVGNHGYFWSFYQLNVTDHDTVEIWHTNAQGDRDRHVCTITEKPQ